MENVSLQLRLSALAYYERYSTSCKANENAEKLALGNYYYETFIFK